MVKSVEQTKYNYARGTLRAFLEGSRTLNWLLATINASGVRGIRLAEIFHNLRTYGNPERYQQAYSACREKGWFRSQ